MTFSHLQDFLFDRTCIGIDEDYGIGQSQYVLASVSSGLSWAVQAFRAFWLTK